MTLQFTSKEELLLAQISKVRITVAPSDVSSISGQEEKNTANEKSNKIFSCFFYKNSEESADSPLFINHFNFNTSSVNCNMQYVSPFSCDSINQYWLSQNTKEESAQRANVSPSTFFIIRCLL